MEVVDVLLLAHLLERAPVLVRYPEPLGVPGPDVHVDGGEVVVLLVPRGPRPRNLIQNKINFEIIKFYRYFIL